MRIREATMADVEGIYKLEQASFSVPWSRASIEQEFRNDVAHYLVAEEEGQIIGYVGVWCVIDEGQITNVAVHKTYRRQGVGRQLINALMTFVKAKDLYCLLLEVRESNTSAQGLYTACGFKSLGIRKNYYSRPTEHGLLMSYVLK